VFVSGNKKIGVTKGGMISTKNTSISIEPFDCCANFTLWQQWVKSLLTQEGTINTSKVKTYRTEKMMDDEWMALKEKGQLEKMRTEEGEDLKDIATSAILLCLANNTLCEVFGLIDPIDI